MQREGGGRTRRPRRGSATPPVSVQVSQAFLWYLHGVSDALANTRRGVVPRQTPEGSGASPGSSPSPGASSGGTP